MKQSLILTLIFCIALIGAFSGCDSLDNSITSDPYGGGKEPLGIRLSGDAPDPSSGYPGDTVVFKASGLLKWCDPATEKYQFKFYLGEQDSKIVTATDTTLTVVVPHECSSGVTYLVLQNQVFYGPNFPVLGKITIDSNYKLMAKGTDDAVYDCLEKYTNVPNFFLVGGFSSIGGTEHTGISYVDNQGNVAAGNTSNFGVKTGVIYTLETDPNKPYIASISALKDGRMVVSGSFTGYENKNSAGLNGVSSSVKVDNMIVLKPNAVADTSAYTFDDIRQGSYYGVSRFKGGTGSAVIRSFVTKDDKIVSVGNISQYLYTIYADSYAASYQNMTTVANVFRTDDEGNLDKSYRPAVDGSKYTGAAGGIIYDADMDENDGIILVGSFTSFDGIAAHGIVRLDANGDVDRGFLQKTGSAANNTISIVRYNKSLRKMMLTGSFNTFNGQSYQNVVMLNSDGSVDPTFKLKDTVGGSANYAQLIDKQKVVVSGSFTKYNGIPRPGFLILDMDGTARQDYNVPGSFTGQLKKVVETETTVGSYGLLLLGDFSQFNGIPVNNVVMLEADFDH